MAIHNLHNRICDCSGTIGRNVRVDGAMKKKIVSLTPIIMNFSAFFST